MIEKKNYTQFKKNKLISAGNQLNHSILQANSPDVKAACR